MKRPWSGVRSGPGKGIGMKGVAVSTGTFTLAAARLKLKKIYPSIEG